jgi:aconitate hydratase
MLLPEVVGVNVTGSPQKDISATDIVLNLTNKLRQVGVVGKFVEFYGEGLSNLTLADRATISNMAPEYGATSSFFPIDYQTLKYMKMTGRTEDKLKVVEQYAKANQMFRLDSEDKPVQNQEYSQVVELDLSQVRPSVAGPKRPQDLVTVTDLKTDFLNGMVEKKGFKHFGVKDPATLEKEIDCDGEFTLRNGSLLIAAITSCTNTSNPYALLSAGLLAKAATEKGLSVPPFVKTSLSPGSKAVTKYLENSGLSTYLDKLGFYLAGYGCMTCIGNSGDLHPTANKFVEQNLDMVFSSVLSGNRNFEGRVHPYLKANYLASPLYVVAYALAGKVDIDFETEPIQNDVFLRDLLPNREDVMALIDEHLTGELFLSVYKDIEEGNESWRNLQMEKSLTFPWDLESTYIRNPPYFDKMKPVVKDNASSSESSPDSSDEEDQMVKKLKPVLKNAQKFFEYKNKLKLSCLLLLGDSITTDHISPAGKISRTSPASKYLQSHDVKPKDFNSYGTRRGNHEVMCRGTFANVRITNKLAEGVEGPFTKISKGDENVVSIYEGAEAKKFKNLLVVAGKEYGSGSSRDWAAKGPQLMGVKAVIAESYERIHRSNLIGMGILPLEFTNGQSGESLGLTGWEKFKLQLKGLGVKSTVVVTTDTGVTFECLARVDTDVEMQYLQSGGILVHVMKKILAEN